MRSPGSSGSLANAQRYSTHGTPVSAPPCVVAAPNQPMRRPAVYLALLQLEVLLVETLLDRIHHCRAALMDEPT